jgi:DNA-directed RNA polymerase specialized sigma24 family protein
VPTCSTARTWSGSTLRRTCGRWRRHGPLVLGACLRVLNDRHAAEDAFQVTFALLTRKAGSLKRPEALGPWLYGVATRTALKARAGDARRRACERRAAVARAAEQTDDLVRCDLRPVLDSCCDS